MRVHGFNGALPVILMAISCGRCDDDSPADDSVVHSESDSEVEDADQDGSPAGQDCDDNNPSVYPGAEEFCDGVDNDCNEFIDDVMPQVDTCNGHDDDCDGMIDEDELAVFESESGGLSDYSVELLGATAADPLQIALSDVGELRVCGGERRYLALDISSSVHVVPADPTLTTEISAGDVGGTVVNVIGDSLSTVTIEGVSIRDGVGDCLVETRLTGGGICCVGDLRLELLNVTIEDNSAGSGRIGGGMMTQGCTVVLEDSLVTRNVATGGGGGIFVAGGDLEISNSALTYNEGSGGSAIGARSYYDSATLTEVSANVVMRDSVVTNNFSGVAITIYRHASLECVGDSAGEYGIVDNDAEFGAVYMWYESFGFTGTNCDMGSAADGNDNSGPDVYGDDDVPWTADIGNDATFFCSIEQDGCTIE